MMASRWNNYPKWVDLVTIWVEEDIMTEEMSACCDAPQIGHTWLCAECREFGF